MSCEHIGLEPHDEDGIRCASCLLGGEALVASLNVGRAESRAREARLLDVLGKARNAAEIAGDDVPKSGGLQEIAWRADMNALRAAIKAYDALASSAAPACSGEWVSGSGGHREHAPCGRPADWWHPDDPYAYCDTHLVEHDREYYVRVRPEAPAESPGELTALDLERLAKLLDTVCAAEFFNSRHKCDADEMRAVIRACAARAKGRK